ncbi:hypothetical protein D3C71_2218490 [compost metagenome]
MPIEIRTTLLRRAPGNVDRHTQSPEGQGNTLANPTTGPCDHRDLIALAVHWQLPDTVRFDKTWR